MPSSRFAHIRIERFRQALRDAREDFPGEDYDLEAFEFQVCLAVERFNDAMAAEHQGIRAAVVDPSFNVVVTF